MAFRETTQAQKRQIGMPDLPSTRRSPPHLATSVYKPPTKAYKPFNFLRVIVVECQLPRMLSGEYTAPRES